MFTHIAIAIASAIIVTAPAVGTARAAEEVPGHVCTATMAGVHKW